MTDDNSEEMRELARQLRKPEGELGRQVGSKLNDGNRLINSFAIGALDLARNGRVLEIGMGNGFFSRDIVARAPGTTYVGYDYSADMVDAAINLNRDLIESGSAKFVHGDLDCMPFEDEFFDSVITVNTLYFWSDPAVALDAIKRVMTASATLVIAIRPKRVMRHYPMVQYGFRLYSAEEVERLLSDAGFEVTNVEEHDEPEREIDGKMYAIASLIVVARIADQE